MYHCFYIKTFCVQIIQMQLLNHTKLSSQEDWDRAYMVLSAIGNGYVWQNGEDDPAKVGRMFFL